MQQLELEGIAEALLAEGGQADDAPPRLASLVTTLLGPGAIDTANGLRGDAALARVGTQWRIYVRHKLPIERKAFAVCHELAEWWFRVRERYEADDLEHAADYVAAAVMAPRRAFRLAVEDVGHDFGELAAAFRTTETHVALREAELDVMPRAVVTPARVRVRGPEAWVWPAEPVVRRWARRPIPGVRARRLSEPGRVVIDAEDAA